MADIPAERQSEFRQYVVEIDLEDNATTVNDIVNYWLNHPAERIERARIGQEINLKHYTYDSFIDNMFQQWTAYRNGIRGMVLPHPFSLIKPWCLPDHPKANNDCGYVSFNVDDIIKSRKN